MYCGKCGGQVNEGTGFCPNCGNPVGNSGEQNNNLNNDVQQASVNLYGNVGARVGAFIIDYILWIVIFYAFTFLCNMIFLLTFDNYDGVTDFHYISVLIAAALSWFFYFVLQETRKSSTLGKSILHLSVVDSNNNAINLVTSFKRNIMKLLFLIIPLGWVVELIIVIQDKKGQSLHDKVSNTYVIKEM